MVLDPRHQHPDLGPLKIVILQGTSLCNLDCDYCYIPQSLRKTNGTFPLEMIDPIFCSIFTSPYLEEQLSVQWHAGEPLTQPIAYYREAIEKILALKKTLCGPDFKLFFELQTNGTLINQEWCDFFKEQDIHFGISCDGPAFLHDTHRKNWGGHPTHAQVMQAIKLLQQNDIKVSPLAVVTPDTLPHADAFLDFFLENGLYHFAINLVEPAGLKGIKHFEDPKVQEQYKQFMARLLERVNTSEQPISIREFTHFFKNLMSKDYFTTSISSEPYQIISIDYQGNFSTFSPELLTANAEKYGGNFVLGNLLTDTLEAVTQSEKFRAMWSDIRAGKDACQQTCEYYAVCGGGEPAEKYGEHGTFTATQTTMCKLDKQILADLILDDVDRFMAKQSGFSEVKS